jgi:hypothetical protein
VIRCNREGADVTVFACDSVAKSHSQPETVAEKQQAIVSKKMFDLCLPKLQDTRVCREEEVGQQLLSLDRRRDHRM